MGSGITDPLSGILSRGIEISSAVRWSGTVFRQKNALMGRTCSRLKTQLYFWRNNLFRYLNVRNTTFLVRRWLSAGSCLAIDSFCFDSFFVTIPYIHWNIELVWVFWLPNKDLIRKIHTRDITFCQWFPSTPRTMILYMPFRQWQNPVITAIFIALGTVTCIFLLTMLNRQYMVPCKPLAAPDSKPLINANIYQVATVGRRRKITKPVLIMLGRKCAKLILTKLTKAKE